MDYKKLGETIKLLRKTNGLTQKELAKLMDVNIDTVRRYENGGVEPRLSKIELIAEILDVHPMELLISLYPTTETRRAIWCSDLKEKLRRFKLEGYDALKEEIEGFKEAFGFSITIEDYLKDEHTAIEGEEEEDYEKILALMEKHILNKK